MICRIKWIMLINNSVNHPVNPANHVLSAHGVHPLHVRAHEIALRALPGARSI